MVAATLGNMGEGMTQWPDGFPAQCPPEDAMASTETFYRLVRSDPALEQDFWSYQQLLAAGLERPRLRTPDPCIAAGVSVFATVEGVSNVRKAFGALRSMRVASGSLSGSGVVKETGRDGHHTWWRPVADEAWQGFVVLTP